MSALSETDSLAADLADGFMDITPKSETSPSEDEDEDEDESFDLMCKPGSLLKKLVTPGRPNGAFPPVGSLVKAHYTGTLLDGTKFDSSVDRGKAFEFDIGTGSVIKGWDVGIATMIPGEKAIFKVRARCFAAPHPGALQAPPGSPISRIQRRCRCSSLPHNY